MCQKNNRKPSTATPLNKALEYYVDLATLPVEDCWWVLSLASLGVVQGAVRAGGVPRGKDAGVKGHLDGAPEHRARAPGLRQQLAHRRRQR